MARIARVIVPGIPHHVIQRGNRRQLVFFTNEDRLLYLRLLKEEGDKAGLHFWAYCLMDNHVHLIVVPKTEQSLAKGLGEAHRRYTQRINFREGWNGYLWQGRFSSFPLDEKHLYAAVRYVERNPIRAGIVRRAEDFLWSSAKAHIRGTWDPFLSENFLTREITNWAEYLTFPDEKDIITGFQKHCRTGRPFGDNAFLTELERKTGRILKPQKPGKKISIVSPN